MAFLYRSSRSGRFRGGIINYELIQSYEAKQGLSRWATDAQAAVLRIWEVLKWIGIVLGVLLACGLIAGAWFSIILRPFWALLGVGDVTGAYHPFPSNDTIPIATPQTIALAKVAAAFSFIDWIPVTIFTSCALSRSPRIILGTVLALVFILTTSVITIPPVVADHKAYRNHFGYKWDSSNSSFVWGETGAGSKYVEFTFGLAGHFLVFSLAVFWALLKFVLLSGERLPRRYKPVAANAEIDGDSELEEILPGEHYLADIFQAQDNNRKFLDMVDLSVGPHGYRKREFEHSVSNECIDCKHWPAQHLQI